MKQIIAIGGGGFGREIKELKIEDFIPLGVRELLTMQRQNGLGSLIQRIVDIANTK